MGLASYYRRFIGHFAEIAALLYRLQEKGGQFHWSELCDAAFSILKQSLTSAPVLGFPHPNDIFISDTDASDIGIGGVLSQKQDGLKKINANESCMLTKAEQNYSVTCREMLALTYFSETFPLLFAWEAICGQNRSCSLDLVATVPRAQGTSG